MKSKFIIRKTIKHLDNLWMKNFFWFFLALEGKESKYICIVRQKVKGWGTGTNIARGHSMHIVFRIIGIFCLIIQLKCKAEIDLGNVVYLWLIIELSSDSTSGGNLHNTWWWTIPTLANSAFMQNVNLFVLRLR